MRCVYVASVLYLLISGGAVHPVAAQQSRPLPVTVDTGRVTSSDRVQDLVIRVDSLERQLAQHRFAENFLDSALDEQSNRFALIIGALLSVIGFITYQGFRHEVRRLEDVIRAQRKELDSTLGEAIGRVEKAEIRLQVTTGNVQGAIAQLSESRKRYVHAFGHGFIAASHFCKVFTMGAEKPGFTNAARRACLSNLRSSLARLSRLSETDEKTRKVLDGYHEEFSESFERLASTSDEEIRDLSAEIRVSLRRFKSPPLHGDEP